MSEKKKPKFKVGDEFTIPSSRTYTGVYSITRITYGYKDKGNRYWAYFPEYKVTLVSTEERMTPVTKLQKALL